MGQAAEVVDRGLRSQESQVLGRQGGGLLERTDIASRGPNDPQAWFLFEEASRLMYADRDLYVGDVGNVPVAGLLEPAYLDQRAKLIGSTAEGLARRGQTRAPS